MDTITKCRSEARGADLVVKVEWSNGPRTPAWDRLWRTILSQLDAEPAPIDSGPHGQEGDDA